jgi:hypothetical protein
MPLRYTYSASPAEQSLFRKQQQLDEEEQRELEYDAPQALLVWRRLYRDLRDNPAFEDVFATIDSTSSVLYNEDMET